MNKYSKMSDKEYFAINSLEVASVSMLKRIDCPAKAVVPFRPTAAMLLGTLVHCAVLEPEEFGKRYAIAPKVDRRTKIGKETWKEFVKINADKQVITMEDSDTAMHIARCVRAHSVANDLLTGGEPECVFQWTHEKTGVKCKGKADYVKKPRTKDRIYLDPANDGILVDLKTANDASPSGFSKACANLGYHLQDAHYSEGSDCGQFLFVVVETSYPFIVEVYELDDEAKEAGKAKVDAAIRRYDELNLFNLWDANYSGEEKITKLSLPKWSL
jgi:exodeoxyribonuclease VIII